MSYSRITDFTTFTRLRAADALTEFQRVRRWLNGGATNADLAGGFGVEMLAQPNALAFLSFAAEGLAMVGVPSDKEMTVKTGRIKLPARTTLWRVDLTYQVTLSGAGTVRAGDFSQLQLDLRQVVPGGVDGTRLNAPIDVLVGKGKTPPFPTTGTIQTAATSWTIDEASLPTLVVGEMTGTSAGNTDLRIAVVARKGANITDARTVTVDQLRGTITVAFQHQA